MSNPTAPRVLIVGGGIAGVVVATKLGRTGRADVTLVDKSLSHVWKPTMHTIAAGTSSAERQRLSLLALAKRNNFTFWPGSLAHVDRSAKRVLLRPFAAPIITVAPDQNAPSQDTPSQDAPAHASSAAHASPTHALPYDALVLALGSRANDFGTAGVAEHCRTVDDLIEAEDFRTRLRRAMFTPGDGIPLEVAIVGGGATGVELAAELTRAIGLVSGYGPPAMAHKLRLTLIEAGPRLLPAFPERIAAAAGHTLTQLGVAIRTGATVTRADEDGFVLKDGTRVAAALTIWAAGVKAPDVLSSIEGLERSRTGQLTVTSRLRTTRDPSIFALGDCASLPTSDDHPVPATAQAARQQALYLARHLPDLLARHDPSSDGRAGPADTTPPFQYHDRGSIVSLADYNGWGTFGHYAFGGGPLKGLTARWAHALLYRQHRYALLGAPRGSLDWLADRLVSLVRPPVQLD